jgi:hypothetical protein
MYRAIIKFVIFCGMFFVGPLHAAWAAPVNVSALNETDTFPQIAVNSNGDATAVWYNETLGVVQASSKFFGGSWQAEETLSQLVIIPHGWDVARVAMDSYGNATAVWMAFNGSNYIIQASTKPFGGSWQTEPDTLSTDPLNPSDAPQIVVDSNGNATAVWGAIVGDHYFTQASTKPVGTTWQTPVNISNPSVLVVFPAIVVDGSGNVTAAWTGQQVGSGTTIAQAATKPFGEAWQEPITLALGTPQTAPLQIATNGDGTVTVIWLANIGITGGVQASTKPFNGAWQASPDTIPESEHVYTLPQIAVDSMGNSTAVWLANDGTIHSSTKPFGASWQETPDSLPASMPNNELIQVTVDVLGNLTAVWQASDGTNYEIQAASKQFGAAWQGTADILSLPSQNAYRPQIAVDGSCNVTVVWESQFGGHSVIQSATKSFGLTVTNVRPSSGPQKGKNTVTITGTNFVDVASVYFGSIPSPSFIVNSPTTITAVVPQGKGTVDVTVTASSRTSPVTPSDLYTYRRFKGKVNHHKHKLFMKTKWNTSAAAVTGYEIFARKKKIATIPAQNKAQATIRLHPHHVHHEISNKYRHYLQHKYKVRAIDADGTASAFTFVDIHR